MNNQFRQPPQAAVARQYEGQQQPAHVQQQGLYGAPIDQALQEQFYLKHVSKLDGKVYEGQFTVKKLSIRDLAVIGVRKTQLNGGYHYNSEVPGAGVDEQTDWINQTIAHLEVALIQWPMWFDLEKIYDSELLGAVFQRAIEFENTFFRPNRGQNVDPGRSQNDSSGTGAESGTAGHVTAVVGGEVPDSLEP